MTELTEPLPAAAQPSPDWPGTGGAGVTDPVVAQALARLEALPQVPVAEHETVYSELHDELLAALNSDPANSGPADSDPANSEHGSTDPTDGAA
ncbi:hypothetical protein [Pseudarthrobacter oxydans]|uniref:hypothetical protein n=1 Tax=Pseudarthrobacter oxydans TaxID=1671 RepID=UPI002AA8E468|nr:hypothetical protein [Pseudarthrobacter oxydans]WPU10877.1 hypothetical protein SMD14_07760 [Pseudarthrobacter oxydans]